MDELIRLIYKEVRNVTKSKFSRQIYLARFKVFA